MIPQGCSWYVPQSVLYPRFPKQMQSASQVNCNIGFAQLAPNLSKDNRPQAVLVLMDMLKDVPHLDFDICLAWAGEHPLYECYLLLSDFRLVLP
jgi:hypothetical protein